MEGGWDMDIKEQEKAPVDWSRGNALHSLGYAFILYVIFVLSAKMKAKHNFMFFVPFHILNHKPNTPTRNVSGAVKHILTHTIAPIPLTQLGFGNSQGWWSIF